MIKYWAMRGRNFIKKVDIIREDEYANYYKQGSKEGIIGFKNESGCGLSKLLNTLDEAKHWLMQPHIDSIHYHEKIISNIKKLKV